MKLIRIISVAAATLFVASFAHAQIKAGASSINVFATYDKTSGQDASGSAFGSYNYFATDNVSVGLGTGLFFGGSTGYLAGGNVKYYFSRDKIAPYIGAGLDYFKPSGTKSMTEYEGFVGFESFVSERTSIDTRGRYKRSTTSGSKGTWGLQVGLNFYFN